jgi:RNA polymerase sigma-70 factor (ECF subfamily)
VKDPNVNPDRALDAGEPEPSLTPSLLERLQGRDADAWRRLTSLYGPPVYAWCRHAGLSPEDAADVGQEVFQAVARTIGTFRRQRPGDSFAAWLRTVTRNKVRDHWRRSAGRVPAAGGSAAQEQLLAVAEDAGADSDPTTVAQEAGSLYRRALELLQSEFEARTWQAFWQVAVEGRPVAEVAAEMQMSPGAVYIAKSRVLKRLRQEFDGVV